MIDWDAALARIAPFLFEIEVPGGENKVRRTTGIVVEGGWIAGWAGVVHGAADLSGFRSVSVRQGHQRWSGAVDQYRQAWCTCAVGVPPPPVWAPAAVRASSSLEEGEEIAIVGHVGGSPRVVAEGQLIERQPANADSAPYGNAYFWEADADASPLPGRLVIDREGQLAGLAEIAIGPLVAVLPSEFLARLGTSLIALFVEMGRPADAISAFVDKRATIADPWAFCAAGRAYAQLGDVLAASRAWQRAHELDPENPWPMDQIARLASGSN